jgi:hypothetical protein
VFETIGKFAKKGATKIVIVNLSDIKPVPIGTAAAMQFIWDPAPLMSPALPSPAHAEEKFLATWLQRQQVAVALLHFLSLHAHTHTHTLSLSQSLRNDRSAS